MSENKNEVIIGKDVHVILIGHKKRQGKDTFALELWSYLGYKGVKTDIMHFADPLKSIMAEAIGVSRNTLDMLKNENDYYRGMLQRFGSGKMKEYFGQMCWKDIIERQVREAYVKDGTRFVIVPDFRFPQEYMEGATTVNVVRPDQVSKDDHISETALDGYAYHHKVVNDGTLADLHEKAKLMATELMLGAGLLF